MSGPDIRQLSQESMPAGSFPVARRSDYRVYIASDVHTGISAHAAAKTDVEICGVLVGLWEQDVDGPFARIVNYIRCDSATQKFAEVTFTHESWAQINHEMDTKYSEQRIIGWYHSHPDFGIFLSDRDVFIQQNFFSGPGQVALVVDPVRHLEGLFEWREGKPQLISHYWVGDRIVTSAESYLSRIATAEAFADSNSRGDMRYDSSRSGRVFGSVLTLGMTALCMFLLGYFWQFGRSQWQEQMLREGAIAHYGVFNLQMLGWEDQMREALKKLKAASEELDSLADDHLDVAGKDRDEVLKRWRAVRQRLAESSLAFAAVRDRYRPDPVERGMLQRLTSEKIAEMSGGKPRVPVPVPKAAASSAEGDAKAHSEGDAKSRDGRAEPKSDSPQRGSPASDPIESDQNAD